MDKGDIIKGTPTLKDFYRLEDMDIYEKAAIFSKYLHIEISNGLSVMREIVSPMDHVVDVRDPWTGEIRRMVMFGSNNYLGLATNPEVRERTLEYIEQYGLGLGGPPMLNGTMEIHRKLERELAELKGCEDAMLFSSGFAANLGWTTALVGRNDAIIIDELAHASIIDGARACRGQRYIFPHNDVNGLEEALATAEREGKVNKFVVVEGVYSMDGDIPPLDEIHRVCREHGAFLVLDDAHGTGVVGENGRGTAEMFNLEGKIDLVMGTFSKALASTGGFLAGKREVIEYLRFFARPYFFSASMPPSHIAAVLAAIEVMKDHGELRKMLHDNVSYLLRGLEDLGLNISTQSAIVPVYVPRGVNIRRMAKEFHDNGLFMNAIEYPAVPLDKQRFRVSVMATHTREDLDMLIEAMDTIGKKYGMMG